MSGGTSVNLRSSECYLPWRTAVTKPRNKFHLASAGIYCTRVFLSLIKTSVPDDILSSSTSFDVTHCTPLHGYSLTDTQTSSPVSRSLFYSVVEIDSDDVKISVSPSYDAMHGMPLQSSFIGAHNTIQPSSSTSFSVIEIEPNDDKLSSSSSPSHNVPSLQGFFASAQNSIQDSIPSYSATELQPDDHYSFKINKASLIKLVKEKDLNYLNNVGGVEAVVSALGSDPQRGIGGDVGLRQRTFGSNNISDNLPTKSFWPFLAEAVKERINVFYLACFAVSLIPWIINDRREEGWYDGASNLFSVVFAIANFSLSNFMKYRKFIKLTKISNNIETNVVRDGRRQKMSIHDILVGDIVFLKIGDRVPADGLILMGHYLRVDQSSLTGESDHVEVDSSHNPFLFSGSKVTDGYAQMVVTSVGMNTKWGEMMTSITCDANEQTPLQGGLDKLTSLILKIGLVLSVIGLVVLLVRFFTGNMIGQTESSKLNKSMKKTGNMVSSVAAIISTAFTIFEVTIPEGLYLAVPQTLANSLKRMLSDQALVRKLSACETMAFATTICTDETTIFTPNEVKVNKVWLGKEQIRQNHQSSVSPNVLDLIQPGIALNATGSVYGELSGPIFDFSGSPTEKAILSWAVAELNMDVESVKESFTVLQFEPFGSQKTSRVLVRKKANNTMHVYWKGAAERILQMCTRYYDACGHKKEICHRQRKSFEEIIENMAASKLGCIAIAHKEIAEKLELNEEHKKLQEKNLTVLGLIGLEDTGRVKKAMHDCHRAGVNVKIITGENIYSAKAIAIECAILSGDQDQASGSVLQGAEFRDYTPQERMEKVEKICVMAGSSPSDKLLMIECLKQKGHVVVVTGHDTSDAQALKEADIGLSMGVQGTDVAKKSSDIVILDDAFVSVVAALLWGRCFHFSIQKLVEFQLTSNVAALAINFVVAVSAGNPPLTAVQLLWVNLIRTILFALGLTAMKPTKELLGVPPVNRDGPLITNITKRDILAQALYRITAILTLHFRGESIFRVNENVKHTLIFNTFVLCQVFNEFDARKLAKKNVFKGIHTNRLRLGITAVTLVLQVVIVEFLKKFANTERLNGGQWGACIGIAALSWPIEWIVKCIPVPDKPILSYLK